MTNLFKEFNKNMISDNENIGNPSKKKNVLKMEILELKRTKKFKLLDRLRSTLEMAK